MITDRLKLGKRKSRKLYGCLYVSDWIKPCGKFWKRQASKRFRKVRSAGSYGFYKKTLDLDSRAAASSALQL